MYVIIPPGEPNNGLKDGYLIVHKEQLKEWREKHGDKPTNFGVTTLSEAEAKVMKENLSRKFLNHGER
jgi:hypothetical protein